MDSHFLVCNFLEIIISYDASLCSQSRQISVRLSIFVSVFVNSGLQYCGTVAACIFGMEAAGSSETSVTSYEATQCHNPNVTCPSILSSTHPALISVC